jgi:hypothetical protein
MSEPGIDLAGERDSDVPGLADVAARGERARRQDKTRLLRPGRARLRRRLYH